MDTQSQKIISQYAQAYEMLYKRAPRELRLLNNGWVSVNGARMRISELEYLTEQLEKEYSSQWQIVDEKRSIVQKLLKWFKQ